MTKTTVEVSELGMRAKGVIGSYKNKNKFQMQKLASDLRPVFLLKLFGDGASRRVSAQSRLLFSES